MRRNECHALRAVRWPCLALILCPGVALATPLDPAAIYWFGVVLVWLFAVVVSLCKARKWGWRVVLPICLSLPLVLCGIYLATVIDAVFDDWAGQKFDGLCQAHVGQATQVLAVASVSRPKHFVIDETANFRSPVVWHLGDCIRDKRNPACTATGIEFLEFSEAWYMSESGQSRVCEDKTCRQEIISFRRSIDRSGGTTQLVPVEKPVSNFVIRIGAATDSGQSLAPFKRAEAHTITLEDASTGKVYARTAFLTRHSSQSLDRECPDSVNEVASMILRVFPSPSP